MNSLQSITDEMKTGDVAHRFIHPGGFLFADKNFRIHTILGSCIAITLWHPDHQVGGMCHFVLPEMSFRNKESTISDRFDGRYSTGAMALFERSARKRGIALKEFEAKLFGGSNMLTNSTLKDDQLVGTKNTEAALMHLSAMEIPILVADVGETGHRRIIFDVEKGDVWVKHIPLKKIIPKQF